MSEEFKAGREAELRGLMNDANPFRPGSKQSAEWVAGFYGSLRDKREAYIERMRHP